jgi:hypothetical protein
MIGLLHYVVASSDTLGEALRRGVRYSAIIPSPEVHWSTIVAVSGCYGRL